MVVLVAVVAVIILYYRWWRSVIILVVPLLLATVYSFAVASLWPFGITELNSNTAFLGSIIVGNGINFGIILLARYTEERRRGTIVHDALVTAVWSARTGTLSAALAAGVSYAALIVTEFRGFRQFGFIGGMGMLASWGVAFVLMPPLIAWLDWSPRTAPGARGPGIVARLEPRSPGTPPSRSSRASSPPAQAGRSTSGTHPSSSTTSRSSAAPTRGRTARATGVARWMPCSAST